MLFFLFIYKQPIIIFCLIIFHDNVKIGAVTLALQCARDCDRDGLAISYYQEGCPPNDSRREIYDLRRHCFEIVFDVLMSVNDMLSRAKTSHGVTINGVSMCEHLHIVFSYFTLFFYFCTFFFIWIKRKYFF